MRIRRRIGACWQAGPPTNPGGGSDLGLWWPLGRRDGPEKWRPCLGAGPGARGGLGAAGRCVAVGGAGWKEVGFRLRPLPALAAHPANLPPAGLSQPRGSGRCARLELPAFAVLGAVVWFGEELGAGTSVPSRNQGLHPSPDHPAAVPAAGGGSPSRRVSRETLGQGFVGAKLGCRALSVLP